jgi:hypothetical protein
MVDNAGTDHIQIDVNQTLQQMLSGFDGSGMVSIFPESPFAFFPLVVFLLPFFLRSIQSPGE